MRIEFNNYKNDMIDMQPQLGLYWLYYDSKPKDLVARNKYRAKLGMPKILDDGSRLYLEMWFFGRVLGLCFIIRPVLWESKP